MRVGLSPFGIWRPGNPAGITGLDAYADIFADSRKWLENGWLDYLAPQLYWSLASTGQNFSLLLDWWLSVNTQRRHVWPGLAAYRVADGTSSQYTANEIVAQIAYSRTRAGSAAGGASGNLLYNTTTVRLNRGGLADALGSSSFREPALVPGFPWLDNTPPASPTGLAVTEQSSSVRIQWQGTENARWWLVQWRTSTAWNATLVWGSARSFELPFTGAADRANVIAVTALDASMNASAPVTWRASSY